MIAHSGGLAPVPAVPAAAASDTAPATQHVLRHVSSARSLAVPLAAAGLGSWQEARVPTSAGAACPKLPEPPPAPSLTTLLAPLWQPGSTALPQSSDDVVRTLREQFEGPTEHSADPFAALRSAASASRALHPDALPAEMPAFVLPGHTLLPGEHASFVFFEPRYRRMCELALGGTPPDGRFVHLAARRIKSDFAPVGTLVSILVSCPLELSGTLGAWL